MLILLVAIIIGGIIALRMIPEQDVVVIRAKEENLHKNLSQIRAAFDLRWIEDETWDPDLSNPGGIQDALDELVASGVLRAEDIKDPTIKEYLWGTSARYFWQSSANIASNTSFEAADGLDNIPEWVVPADTIAATVSAYLEDTTLDDYPHQNKLGQNLLSGGAALEITK
jgi:hypothetical protein